MLLNQVLNTLYAAADQANISEDYIKIISHSEKKLEFTISIKMDNDSIQTFTAFKVQHSSILGPTLGSISIIPNATIEDCEALAMLMSIHNALLGIPLGGSKGIILADLNTLSKNETEKLYFSYLNVTNEIINNKNDIIKLQEIDSSFISYPILNYIEKKFFDINSVVNRPADYFGIDLGDSSYIYSIIHCIKEIMVKFERNVPDKELSVGITVDPETFNKDLLIELKNLGLNIAEIQNGDNLNICDSRIWEIIYNYPWDFDTTIRVKPCDQMELNTTADELLLTKDLDILILQNPNIRITTNNADTIKAKYIIEAEENLISPEAEAILESIGIIIIPDFISLSGVLIKSYLEWLYGQRANMVGYVEYKNIMNLLIHSTLEKIWKTKELYDINTRNAAIVVAINKLIDIQQKKGI